jgi:predicted Ser/Thr protein kinase
MIWGYSKKRDFSLYFLYLPSYKIMGQWLSSTKNEQQQRIEELEAEVAALKQQINNAPNVTNAPKMAKISRKHLEDWIDGQLQKKTVFSVLEKKAEAHIFGMMLDMIEHILETTKGEFMGQEIIFDMVSHD